MCGARASAMLVHTVSLDAGVLRALLERAKLLFSIVDMMSVNGAAFRQVRVACETLTGVFHKHKPQTTHTTQTATAISIACVANVCLYACDASYYWEPPAVIW